MDLLPSQRWSFHQQAQPIVGVHTLDGRYVYLNEESFRAAGFDPEPVYDEHWQNFAAPQTIEREDTAVRQAIATGAHIHVDSLLKTIPNSEVKILFNSRISTLQTKGGSKLILRELQVVDNAVLEAVDQGQIDENEQLDTMSYLERSLKELIMIAKRDQIGVLDYLLEVARLQVKEARDEILSAAATGA